MGRSPCCEKVGLKKGPWTPEEDQKLLAYIEENGHGSWRALPAKAGLQRCGKSCRLRWTNYLRPDIKRGKFSIQEEQTIIQLHALLGNRWSAIATHLPKRTDNEIKNYWNTHLKKRLAKMGIDPVTHKTKTDTLTTASDSQTKTIAASLSHMAQWESARLEAEARLVRESKLKKSTPALDTMQMVWPKSTKIDLASLTFTLSFFSTTEEASWIPETSNLKTGVDFGHTGFTEMLLLDNNFDEENSGVEEVASCVDDEEDDHDHEDEDEDEGNNYWNDILDLVNSPPPASSPPSVF